jgi:hypothetical protein
MRECAHCNRPVESERDAWTETTGWVKPRNAGGYNSITLRTSTGRVMHNACMSLRKSTGKGPIPGQTNIIDALGEEESY